MAKAREEWGSKLAVIMAVAGSAVGLGNFLKFPGMAANHGGGAFMIPYFISLLLLGLPLMWIEWTLGRYGGGFGHGTAPGIFHQLWRKNRFIKYFGVIGIFGPIVIFGYYVVIESWTFAYSWFSLAGQLRGFQAPAEYGSFFSEFISWPAAGTHFRSPVPAYLFFLLTFGCNIAVVALGIRNGIGRLCNIAMPLLLLFALILMVRILCLPPVAGRTVAQGFGFLWNPDFSKLLDAQTWLAAAGQVFFTLSVGIGVILTYASYLKRSDDVVLSGLTSAATNEFAEVILGGSLVIPVAFVMLGQADMEAAAGGGLFSLGFITMPRVLNSLPLPELMGFLWFALLALAGVTSSISLAQPAVAFLEDEFNIPRKSAVAIFAAVTFLLCQPAFFFMNHGVVDEMDAWGGNFCLVLFAAVEAILFAWVFGMNRAWDEVHHGASLRLPRVYRFILCYITPAMLLLILGSWMVSAGWKTLLMEGVKPELRPYILGTRLGLLLLFVAIAVLVKIAWRRRHQASELLPPAAGDAAVPVAERE